MPPASAEPLLDCSVLDLFMSSGKLALNADGESKRSRPISVVYFTTFQSEPNHTMSFISSEFSP
ncbi:hypothetical protein SCLCIDRAFT_1221746 [Scleroderma citrinum Foug A]|uniref:Uncharacterized protein n=1 Tax=Scleroderma citrinum Foug A TaxID=1036808 RepID=A0A0C3D1M5_9AGAM|nr:hypothetical protein SCLCIDRAFT_1221746 [Scleroderma citrinum Foug A]